MIPRCLYSAGDGWKVAAPIAIVLMTAGGLFAQSAAPGAPPAPPSAVASPAPAAPPATPAISPSMPDPKEVLAVMEKVADWQLANPARDRRDGWIQAAGYTGMMALGKMLPAPNKYLDAMRAMGAANAWRPAPRVYHADDHCVGQTYLELYEIYNAPEMLAPLRERFDAIMANPRDDVLEFTTPRATDKWSWCDALFMAPPAWARLAKITGEKKYLDFANRLWWVTSDYLYDKEEHLYFRDSTFFQTREPNGKKTFWSRGNGWVMGGLVRMLQYLPADYPDRPKYVQQLREMSAALKAAQQPDGLWRPGLLDPAAHPQKEVSGSGFDTYAMTWAINHGLLDRAEYLPVVLRAWAALVASVQPDGKLTNVQPVGDQAVAFDANHTTPYGTGAFLLAGSEIYRLAGGKVPAPVAPVTAPAASPGGTVSTAP